jgi:hypothetical protein
VNTVTGLQYKNDPAVFAWELANEPRCQGSGNFPESNDCVINYAVYDAWPQTRLTGESAAPVTAYCCSAGDDVITARLRYACL